MTKSVGGGTARAGKPQRPWPVPVFPQPLPSKPLLDISTILNALKSGQSLEQITATVKTSLDAAVASGRLTAAQESLILAKLRTVTHLGSSGNS